MSENEWYTIKDVENIDSPALVFYPDRINHNISYALSMVGNDPSRLRPHVKTHKSIEITKMLMDAGITKFKCATISEAEMLAMANASDILLAYQPGGPKLERFIQLVNKYPSSTFSCLVDNMMNVQVIANVAAHHRLKLNVYIDINVGMNRTGIAPDQKAVELIKFLNRFSQLILKGLHVYDGHISMDDFEERLLVCNNAFKPVASLLDNLKEIGIENLTIIAGGSRTFSVHAQRQNVECSPGTFILWDHQSQQNIKEQPFIPAALVISRTISQPGENKICLDLGHKSIASENALANRVFFLNSEYLKFISQSEEHLVIETSRPYHPGEVFYGLPYHICPTVALYERAIIIKDNQVCDEWKIIARDRKITI